MPSPAVLPRASPVASPSLRWSPPRSARLPPRLWSRQGTAVCATGGARRRPTPVPIPFSPFAMLTLAPFRPVNSAMQDVVPVAMTSVAVTILMWRTACIVFSDAPPDLDSRMPTRWARARFSTQHNPNAAIARLRFTLNQAGILRREETPLHCWRRGTGHRGLSGVWGLQPAGEQTGPGASLLT